MNSPVTIYKYTNLSSGLVYVGKTKHDIPWRHARHLATARQNKAAKKASRFQNALLADQPFQKEVLAVVDGHEAGCFTETIFIEALKARDPLYGYNLTDGGEGVLGNRNPKSPEHAAKLAAHLLRVRDAMKAAGRKPSGRPRGSKTSEEGLVNIRKERQDRYALTKMSPETRKRVRAERERNRRARKKLEAFA